MIRSCQAGGSVPAFGEGCGGEHRADFSSLLALPLTLPMSQFSLGLFPFPGWIGWPKNGVLYAGS